MFAKYVALIFLGFLGSVLSFPDPTWKNSSLADEIVVTTSYGQLRCLEETNPISFVSCKGIPYAQPPINSLRFRQPAEVNPWTGIRDATKHGNECIQPGLPGSPVKGEEDCLYLNIYTPSLQGNRAVMVFFHGGAFLSGSGNDGNYGPQLLLKEDVVVVTVNYRLGVLGFLSTGDNNAQGNYGLKDCAEALQFISRVVDKFGGDPDRITAFGQSAGGAIVHYLYLFGKFFNRGISESGTALSPWAFQPDPRKQAFILADRLNITATTTVELVSRLRSIQDPKIFAEVLERKLDARLPYQFSPSIENVDSRDPRLVTEHPLAAIKRGPKNTGAYMVGGCSEDSLYATLELINFPSVGEKINQNPELLIPPTWNIASGSREAGVISTELKNLYFTNGIVSDPYEYSKYSTDVRYLYYIYKTARLHSQLGRNPPVYFYEFGYSGENNYGKHLLGLSAYPGAVHGDELGYLFQVEGMVPKPGSTEELVSARLLRMWRYFAQLGNPTEVIGGLLPINWPPVRDNQEFMNITEELQAETQPNFERMKVLSDLDELYGWKP